MPELTRNERRIDTGTGYSDYIPAVRDMWQRLLDATNRELAWLLNREISYDLLADPPD